MIFNKLSINKIASKIIKTKKYLLHKNKIYKKI